MSAPTQQVAAAAPVPAITNPQQLEACLKQLLVNDTQAVKIAEKALRQFSKSEQCLPAYLQQIQACADVGVRQLAAVLARAKIKEHWKTLQASVKDMMKNMLLQSIVKEPVPIVRNSLIAFVTEIATEEVPINNWNELPKFLMTCVKSQEPAHRELGYTLFGELCIAVNAQMKSQMNQLITMFSAGLVDANFNVRVAALRSTEMLVRTITEDQEGEAVYKLLVPVVNTIKECLTNNREDVAIGGFEIFTDLAELKIKSFDQIMPQLIDFTLEIAANKNLSDNTRDRSLNLVAFVAEYKRNILQQPKMMEKLLTLSFTMLLEPEESDELDEDEVTPFKSACYMLDKLCCYVSSKHIFQPVVANALKLVSAQDPFHRKAGVAAIGTTCEGCSEAMRRNIANLVPAVVSCIADTHPQLREQACLTMAGMAQYGQPEIFDYFDQIMPVILPCIVDKNNNVKEKSLHAIDVFVENVGDAVLPYVDKLMQMALTLLTKGDIKTQELVISTIANVAGAIKSKFTPYVKTVLDLMSKMMMITTGGDQMLTLRARATECVGLIAVSMGKSFAPIAEPFLKQAGAGLSIPHALLRELTYLFFGNVARSLEDLFAPYYNAIVEPLFKSAVNEDGAVVKVESGAKFLVGDDDDDDDGAVLPANGDDDDDEYIDADSDEDTIEVGTGHVRTSWVDEKAAAMVALGKVARSVRNMFLPNLKRLMDLYMDNFNHFHYDIRRAVIQSLTDAAAMLNESPEWQTHLNNTMYMFVNGMIEDDDKEVVARICEGIGHVCKQYGEKALVGQTLDELPKMFLLLLQKRARCNENDTNDDDTDHDIVLMDALADCIDDVARVMGMYYLQRLTNSGPNFEPYFRPLFPVLLKYTNENRAPDDRVACMGTLSEVSHVMGPKIIPYVPQLLPAVMSCMKESYPNLKRNSIYCAGVLSQNAKEQMAPYLPTILQGIYPCFTASDKQDPAILDNACGAVARIITSHQSVPLDQILPVLLNALPLRDDYNENEPVFSALMYLIATGNAVIAKHMPKLCSVFAQVIGPNAKGGVTPLLQQRLVQCLKQMRQQYGDQFLQLLNTLKPEEKQLLMAVMQ